MSPITAGCAQFQPQFGDTEANINRMCNIIEKAYLDLIVFPELATSGYEILDRNEIAQLALNPRSSSYIKILQQASQRTDTYIIFGFPEENGESFFNSALLIEPGGNLRVYRKIHLFDREKKLFNPGDKPPFVVETPIGRIGMMICFDWIFPETVRSLALQGAQIIAHPSNLVLQYCQRAMFARSVENGVFTMTCNRIGSESRTGRTLTFTGASQILSPRGETLAQAGIDDEELIIAEIDPSRADDKMITPNNHLLKDRRGEMYGGR